ncbi:Deoxyhypusine hydroxylase, partial [Tetrabaena socialis]
RYSALFALRNKGGREAVAALGAVFGCRSALLKHEVAYVMGQMQDPLAVEFLTNVLKVRILSDTWIRWWAEPDKFNFYPFGSFKSD